jgi:hypothetical protein
MASLRPLAGHAGEPQILTLLLALAEGHAHARRNERLEELGLEVSRLPDHQMILARCQPRERESSTFVAHGDSRCEIPRAMLEAAATDFRSLEMVICGNLAEQVLAAVGKGRKAHPVSARTLTKARCELYSYEPDELLVTVRVRRSLEARLLA